MVGVKFRCSGVVRRCDGRPEFESDPHFFASGVKISPYPSSSKRGISQNSPSLEGVARSDGVVRRVTRLPRQLGTPLCCRGIYGIVFEVIFAINSIA